MPLSTMTVGELKAQLNKYSDDTPVYFTYDYGDYCKTQVAKGIANIKKGDVRYSECQEMNKVYEETYKNNALLLS